jgi:hypothetical protein
VPFQVDDRLRFDTVGEVEQPDPADQTQTLVELLVECDGERTLVQLRDGRRLSVINIAWGYDIGDEYAQITTNISSSVEGESIDLFFTKEVLAVQDESGLTLPTDV